MHDPMVVAFEVRLPFPIRQKWSDAKPGKPRWISRRRRTNEDHLGQPIYRWWRPAGYNWRLAGRSFRSARLATVWHNEPGGRDSFAVCQNKHQQADGTWKYNRRWAWHVHHWSVQVHLWRRIKRFLFERCHLCGRHYPWGYAPIGHGFDSPHSYHRECSSLVHMRRIRDHDNNLIRRLATDLLLDELGETEPELVSRLYKRGRASTPDWQMWYHFIGVMGYKPDDNGKMVKVDA